ncbi:hypothetical protein GYMLUDRAFT_262118 [Collybiopsis luxurians FD-317 M1]|uniref:tRNA N(3)-methylcytidine methyltransferase n=1 Tax=Collybiopsis luxurians FD-317 M1 TaxID=944289 RepID=A0A0D0B7B5_9AGAR|nr:hypothetical protein GYMLUDRAFT_262118 [Collybiopsis luxurians FD-317 M1]
MDSATAATQITDEQQLTKTTSSVHDVNSKDPPFGSRFLLDPTLTFTQNAWDHVPPPADQGSTIAASLARQRAAPVSDEERIKLNSKPAKYWDNFYKNNEANFFKNRKWLHNEFPDLVAAAKPGAGSLKIAEIGCGAGNSIFPVLAANQNPQLELYAYDYSSHAVKLVQHNTLYTSPPCGTIRSAVWDLSSPDNDALPPGLSPASVDLVILVFVLSALHPDEWASAVRNTQRILKPGGKLLFRDYGRYDLTQLRFKNGRLMGDNFYKRGDGTRVYFFELDELSLLFTGKRLSREEMVRANYGASVSQIVEEEDEENSISSASTPVSTPTPDPSGATPSSDSLDISNLSLYPAVTENEMEIQIEPEIHPNLLDMSFFSRSKFAAARDNPSETSDPGLHHPLFTTVNLGIDRRLIVNRKRQLKMYRVWMQGVFQKV